MAPIKTKKQDDLRRLMKERRENDKLKIGKIDSPFAKYNSLGQLSCSICNVFVKSNNLWGPHVAGKIHKENSLKPKKSNVSTGSKSTVVIGVKRNLEQVETTKKLKSNTVKPSEEPQSTKTATLLASYSSSEDSDDNSDQESENGATSNVVNNNSLPSDFFDKTSTNVSTSVPSSSEGQSGKVVNAAITANKAETLPEGFFDDPVLDAKARNIEYKDPVEEEWEKFQKTIAEETNVSKTIIEEDLEESTLERDIDQIDEQIQQWERVKNLQSLADDVKVKAPEKNRNDGESGGTDDELEEDDLLDWRSKGVKKL